MPTVYLTEVSGSAFLDPHRHLQVLYVSLQSSLSQDEPAWLPQPLLTGNWPNPDHSGGPSLSLIPFICNLLAPGGLSLGGMFQMWSSQCLSQKELVTTLDLLAVFLIDKVKMLFAFNIDRAHYWFMVNLLPPKTTSIFSAGLFPR